MSACRHHAGKYSSLGWAGLGWDGDREQTNPFVAVILAPCFEALNQLQTFVTGSNHGYCVTGRGLRIRQSMGWTKVCGTAQSGIRVQKGDARARMLPDNLDHLGVGWRKQGSYETAWVCVHTRMDCQTSN